MKKVLVIGSLNMDMVVRVEQLPAKGETVLGETISYIPGGKGANQACALGRLGANVQMLGCIGKDDFGKIQLSNLEEYKVNTKSIKVSEEKPTGTAIVYVDKKGNNNIVVIQGANKECSYSYLKENDEAFQKADYIVLQMEIPYESILYAIRRGKELGKTIILNPAPVSKEMSDEIYPFIDYITPNESELSKLSSVNEDESVENMAKQLLQKGVENVLVTIGEEGAILVNNQTTHVCKARKVQAIDTTAAGDCFNGAFVLALSEGRGVLEAIEFANKASSIAVTRKGAQTSIPTREEVEKI